MMQTENILNDSRLRALENHTRVNLLRPTLGTTTINGVTCTNNGDGTYTLNGTAIAKITLIIAYKSIVSNGTKKYLLVGSSSEITSQINNFKDDTVLGIERGNGVIVNITDGGCCVYVDIPSGYICDNLLFKPMLTDDLSATYDDFVSGFDCFTPDLKMDLLWANASPTSEFVDQTITLDLSKYKAVVIKVKVSALWNNFYDNFITKSNNKFVLYGANDTNTIRIDCEISDNYIIMGKAKKGTEYDNSVCVPYQIYGVR